MSNLNKYSDQILLLSDEDVEGENVEKYKLKIENIKERANDDDVDEEDENDDDEEDEDTIYSAGRAISSPNSNKKRRTINRRSSSSSSIDNKYKNKRHSLNSESNLMNFFKTLLVNLTFLVYVSDFFFILSIFHARMLIFIHQGIFILPYGLLAAIFHRSNEHIANKNHKHAHVRCHGLLVWNQRFVQTLQPVIKFLILILMYFNLTIALFYCFKEVLVFI
jgi:hypothetical protein